MKEPKFKAKSGQVDFTNIRYAPVVNTVVYKNGKILLVQRSPNMRLYPGFWNGISGFLDDDHSIEEKVFEELSDELGIKQNDVISIKRGIPFIQEAPNYNKTWIVVPILAKVKTAKLVLDWEATKAKWYTPNEAKKIKLLPGFNNILDQFFP